jgi:hypothetical protein
VVAGEVRADQVVLVRDGRVEAVEGDPLADLGRLQQVPFVMRGGRVLRDRLGRWRG